MNHWSFYQIFNIKPPRHRRKAPLVKAFWRRFCLAGGNRIINCHRQTNRNRHNWKFNKTHSLRFFKNHICFFLPVLKKTNSLHIYSMCGGIKTLKHSVTSTLQLAYNAHGCKNLTHTSKIGLRHVSSAWLHKLIITNLSYQSQTRFCHFLAVPRSLFLWGRFLWLPVGKVTFACYSSSSRSFLTCLAWKQYKLAQVLNSDPTWFLKDFTEENSNGKNHI